MYKILKEAAERFPESELGTLNEAVKNGESLDKFILHKNLTKISLGKNLKYNKENDIKDAEVLLNKYVLKES